MELMTKVESSVKLVGVSWRYQAVDFFFHDDSDVDQHRLECRRAYRRYDDAADAYEEGLKTCPGDAALGRGLEDVLKAQAASKAPAGKSCMSWSEQHV